MKKLVAGIAIMAALNGSAMAGDAKKIVVDGSTTVGPIAKAFAEYYMEKYPDVNITVSESGSGNGAKSLINAACDIAMMSRAMKASELKAAENLGIVPVEHIVAMDGLAVVVHPSNPVADLTINQLRDIYAGKINNWKEINGPDLAIVVVSRDTNSGTYECFDSIVMAGEKVAGRAEYVGSNGAIRQRVLSTQSAIGYVGLAFVEGVKALTINGIEGSQENVASNVYPISRPLYLYTNGQPLQKTALGDFLGLSKTPEGIRIIEETGYVPVK